VPTKDTVPSAITLTHDDDISTITLDRPPLNLLSPATLDALAAAADGLEARQETRAVVLRCDWPRSRTLRDRFGRLGGFLASRLFYARARPFLLEGPVPAHKEANGCVPVVLTWQNREDSTRHQSPSAVKLRFFRTDRVWHATCLCPASAGGKSGDRPTHNLKEVGPMRRLLVLTLSVAVAVITFAPLAWAADVQGTIKSVDPSGHSITLADGTQLMIPSQLAAKHTDLQPGANVKASYETQGNQKVITSLQVEPARGAPAGVPSSGSKPPTK
jgi:hypothetical protein